MMMQIALLVGAIWLAITTVLSLAAGWYRLAARYPTRIEEPLLRARVWYGWMGIGVSMHNVITLSACPSGLRVHMMRVFGPFCRDFFVPWEEIIVVRKTPWFTSVAEMRFGRPEVGTLTIESHLADRLWSAVGLQ